MTKKTMTIAMVGGEREEGEGGERGNVNKNDDNIIVLLCLPPRNSLLSLTEVGATDTGDFMTALGLNCLASVTSFFLLLWPMPGIIFSSWVPIFHHGLGGRPSVEMKLRQKLTKYCC
jgi:hypothetical protein